MSHLRYYPNTTSPNAKGTARYPELKDFDQLAGVLFTGEWENYDPTNPWSGPVSIGNPKEDALESTFDWTYDVVPADTAVETDYVLRMHLTFNNGETDVIYVGKVIVTKHI
jgi:hypothetical protein